MMLASRPAPPPDDLDPVTLAWVNIRDALDRKASLEEIEILLALAERAACDAGRLPGGRA